MAQLFLSEFLSFIYPWNLHFRNTVLSFQTFFVTQQVCDSRCPLQKIKAQKYSLNQPSNLKLLNIKIKIKHLGYLHLLNVIFSVIKYRVLLFQRSSVQMHMQTLQHLKDAYIIEFIKLIYDTFRQVFNSLHHGI